MPVTSVVLATRDGSRWITEQVTSILAQTHPIDELVVVDDASSDATVALVRELTAGASCQVVVVAREEPLGIIANFADGLQRATGDVVFFSDQDDVWEPHKVARILAAFEDHPRALAAFSDAAEVDAAGTLVGRTLWQAAGLDAEGLAAWDADPLGRELLGNCVTGATLSLRRSAKQLVLPFPETGYHDGWIALVLAAVGGRGAVIAVPEPLVRYRVHGTNASGGLVPTGRLAGLFWYARRGHAAEAVDLGQLPAAIARVRALGGDPSRLERKLAFATGRRTLPRRLPARLRAMAGLREGYRTFTVGRLPVLLDALGRRAS